MTTPKNCGPAYPVVYSPAFSTGRGMSLRDYFAGQALESMATWIPDHSRDGVPLDLVNNLGHPAVLRARAAWAYDQADAMLAEREKREPSHDD